MGTEVASRAARGSGVRDAAPAPIAGHMTNQGALYAAAGSLSAEGPTGKGVEMRKSSNEVVVERLIAGLNAGDVEVMNEVFTEDIRNRVAPVGRDHPR